MAGAAAEAPTIIWVLPFYLPSHRAGTEQNAHELNRYLMASRGFRAVVCTGAMPDSAFEGVEIVNLFSAGGVKKIVDGASLLATAHYPDYADLARYLSTTARKPLLHIVDSTRFRERIATLEGVADQYVVYGSERTRAEMALSLPGLVLHSPVDWRRYAVATSRRHITLLNVNGNKGGAVLIEIARRMPDRSFLGVRGAYGEMVIDETLPNLTYRHQASSVTEILAETGILLMPSRHEAWGRAAVEAMCSGIPVIAHPCPGLLDALGDAGLFCDRDDIDAWVRTIRALESPGHYRAMSERCLRRSRELDPRPDLARFGAFIDRILGRPAPVTGRDQR